jgi:cardiolipin synthase
MLILLARPGACTAAALRKSAADEWRRATIVEAAQPRVFFDGDRAHVLFESPGGAVTFQAKLSEVRVPAPGYTVRTAPLRLERLRAAGVPGGTQWREAKVIGSERWRHMTTNLLEALAPRTTGHGVYYQGLLADRLVYRDGKGQAHFAALGEQPPDVRVDRHVPMDETLDLLARASADLLVGLEPGGELFVLMTPVGRRFPQPLLLDVKHRQCVWLTPPAKHDPTERGFAFPFSVRGLSALVVEGHGLALLRNPLSCAARLGDLGIQTATRFLRMPLPKFMGPPPPVKRTGGMDLGAWERWLDQHTGTRREQGGLRLLVDGEHFYPRLKEAVEGARRSVDMDVFIFDCDDVAVEFADLLRKRSEEVQVRVILDQMGTLGAASSPPATPLPDGFRAPATIAGYLRRGSNVQVRPFLNPWFTTDHSKLYLVDGERAWLGGMNIGREYRYEWHDLMVEVEGPVVGSLQREFKRAWAHAGVWGDLGYFVASVAGASSAASSAKGEWIPVRRLPTKTAWKPFSRAVQGAIRRAQDHIYVQNPYLFDPRVISGLVYARQRGVDVRVILPYKNDFELGGRGNLVLANVLLGHGVRVYFYPGMTHVKALVVDGWCCLGSGNLNHLSLRVCQEQNLSTSDPQFAAALTREVFDVDFARSYELQEPIEVGWTDILADMVLEGF